ncbi:hypothetical protein ACFYTV_24945 [Streptomyces sp. NPDC004562]|uniref:hypothetical protein n=1 Tax=Streptomyces sp. NPDC004562 TaxID=3364703 RepID=UPI0036CD78C9
MAAQSESRDTWSIARQLRRVRTLYAGGALLWASSSLVTAWSSPGSRPMWTSVLLLVVFTGLLGLSSWWLRRLGTRRAAGEQRPAVAVRASGPARHARV